MLAGFSLEYLIYSQPLKPLGLYYLKACGHQLMSFYGSYSCICESRSYLNVLPLDFLG